MNSFPWDSIVSRLDDDGYPVYDRAYKAEDLREVYSTFFSNGVFDGSPAPFLVTPGSGMNVTVSPGKCHINGAVGYESSTRTVAITASTSQPRIDTVVLRWDSRRDYRLIDLYVVTGTAADTPTRPALKRTDEIWELGIADIYVAQGTSTITPARITDTRLQTARCGIVAPFAEFDTTGLFNQIQNAIDTNIAELEQQTQVAVDLAQSALDGTVAGDLAQQISGKVSKAGDTMTGDLNVRNERPIVRLMAGNQHTALYHQGDGTNLGYFEDDVKQNRLVLRADSSILERPLTVSSGGTGASNAQDACYNLINGRIIKPIRIELGTNANNGSGGFIDFHYNGANVDNTSRIIESASGTIDVNGTPFKRGTGLPVANGGTGATTVAAAKSNLGIADVARVIKSFSLESGHITGSITYYKASGLIFVGASVNRVAGGSVVNGERNTGIILPSGMRPNDTTRSCQFVPTNNAPNPCPNVGIRVNTNGQVNVWYGAIIAPATGYTWNYSGWLVFAPGI